ncbi:Osmoprotectant-binding protein [Alloiococcus otitis]|uniref:ABC transmembrane type-1 domain-containing protein n=1 Tax=Alloiococcus otitis ATCC 51267 TaxID=883081 RepID=K9E8Q5_9LACT|nr:ABC transporter permease/substrate-binding protein [Alloiococcus otitis]EKU93589.1 hypothetical protein HMPREF9698_00884 [Alloiococcus otitis ATCC 51267]SUU80366.1 Osmoprotectant-binding protein [Alloiococcus otitis]
MNFLDNLIETFDMRSGQLWESLLEHIQLSFISLALAVIIAVPLGIYLMDRKKIAEPIIQVTGIFQTIPSLALLGLLIPLLGIGFFPAVVALTVYALLPILRNTYTGLTEIDDSLLEAADAMGMDRSRKLKKVQLPLAMPVIMAGIRTATVLIIGTATVAALIGAGGLGSLILLGIDRADNYLILIGAIPAAILSLVFDGLLHYLEQSSFKKVATTLVVTGGIILAFIFLPSLIFPNDQLVVSGKLGAEPEILMNMYKELIEQDTDLDVQVEENFGKTQFVFNALESHDIDIATEYTGTVLGTFFDEIPEPGTPADQVFDRAQDRLKEEYGMDLLPSLGFNNTYTLAVDPAYAEEHNLETISDLKAVQDDIKVGFTLEFADREDGYLGIQDTYGIEFDNLTTMDPQLRYTAMEQGEVNLVDAYSTDSEIESYDLVVLEDDQNLFPPYHAAPILRDGLLDDHPEIAEIISQLEGLIDDEAMREMNYQVEVNQADANQVARDFLDQAGLLK